MTNHPKRKDGRVSSPSILQAPQEQITRAQWAVISAYQRKILPTKDDAVRVMQILGLHNAKPLPPNQPAREIIFELPRFLV